MKKEEKKGPKGWGHRLKEENQGLKNEIATLRKENRDLQKELGNIRKLVRDVPGAVILVQGEKILFSNQNVCEQLGYSEEEMLAKGFLDLIHPDSVRFVKELFQKRVVQDRFETYMTTKTDETICCEVRVNKTIYHGRKTFLLNIFDLDKRKMQETRLSQSLKMEALIRMASSFGIALERGMTFLEEHLGKISPPLSSAEGSLNSLEKIETVREGGEILSHYLSCLTRAEYDPSEMTLLDLKKIVREAVADSRSKGREDTGLDHKDFTIKTYLRIDSPVYGHKREIQDVFANMITNAVEALRPGGEVHLTTEEHSGHARVYIQDNGTGISKQVIDRIFDPFFTTKEGHWRGLGLSLAHAVIDRHGGGLSVMSREGHGSTFMVELPISERPPSSKKGNGKRGFKNSRILIIADEGRMTGLIYQMLSGRGSKITIAYTGYRSLNMLRSREFDLVIIDRNASYIEAASIIPKIKKIRPGIPVMLLNAEPKDNSPKIGVDLALGRPLDINRTVSLASSLLKRGGPPE